LQITRKRVETIEMSAPSQDPLAAFPHRVEIREPGEMLKAGLTGWESANEGARWSAGALAYNHTWTVAPGPGWASARSKTYCFRSEADASLFAREYGNTPESEQPGSWAKS
jgi:hypothetical protein